jgi:oligopeptide/dipeptide ABC transporter ATP-binding protein
VPSLTALPLGCAFEPRCPLRIAECAAAMPELLEAGTNHRSRCILVEKINFERAK